MTVLEQIQNIFKDVFENDDLVVKNETSAKDIAEWDSLMHIQLIVSIEKHFKIKFKASELGEFREVGHIVKAVENKL